ncbi:MAG TPA: MarR family transcriptional regulator [Pseudonocardia sp.]|mgnify:CR=1 FL=1|uniref:MarR family winged helix-turn-helix transcriptional regulator n=1 Tax=Pseudonocardia sp. TaxID=60912 RepID=UPI002B4AB926|nr:MarR family transcriptional regulator [Pseudonocardia sp.]HLU56276.1 MarR family transcriptional regulator [Pseudonocardia sp.]
MDQAATEPLVRLLVRAGAALQRYTRSAAAAHGLSATALEVLGALVELGEVSQRDLAGHLRLAPATLTPVLDGLERAGSVTRVRDGVDRRVVRAAITPRGRERWSTAVTGVAAAVAALPAPAPAQAELIRAHLLDLLDALDRLSM